MARRTLALIVACALFGVPSCVATPLPTPPTADVSRMHLVETAGEPGAFDVSGAAGAIGGARRIRLTSQRAWREVDVAEDGSFSAPALPALRPPRIDIEALLDERDLFLVAVTLEAGTVALADPGRDADDDGSPDRIDCAPANASLGGRRCPDLCATEVCNGRDDDCDGAIDEGCSNTIDGDGDGFCAMGTDLNSDGDCEDPGETSGLDCDDEDPAVSPGAAEICDDGVDEDCDALIDEGCPGTCVSDADCSSGSRCVDGACVPG